MSITSVMAWPRLLAGIALGLCCATARADLVTYHVDGLSRDSAFGVPGGIPIVLEFSFDDAVPPSFDAPGDHTEYLNSPRGGFLRIGNVDSAAPGFVYVIQDDSGPPGGVLSDVFFYLSPVFGLPSGALGTPSLVVFGMGTMAPAPTPPLSSTALVVPPASAFQFAEIQVQFAEGDFITAFIVDGPVAGPAPPVVAEPSTLATIIAALAAVALLRRRAQSPT